MLKTLLLSGWFRVQPFLKYVVLVMLIAPFVAASSHATSVTQSGVITYASTSVTNDAGSASVKTPGVGDYAVNQVLLNQSQDNLSAEIMGPMPMQMAAVVEPRLLGRDRNSSLEAENPQGTEQPNRDPFATVELAPLANSEERTSELPTSQDDLIERLKIAKNNSLVAEHQASLYAAKINPIRESRSNFNDQIAPGGANAATQQESEDPLGSAYPIPMKWIAQTQESMGSKGGGVGYYRSVPVISPDGRYAVYSRVQLEVNPEQHNSRVSSVLFIEDRKTKQLRVVTSTSRNRDVLINVKSAPDANGEGTIGVLVPVSWSEKGDRFLARRFEGVMNTSDVNDYAVIWHREKDRTNTVGPAVQESDREKISILLGWSKSQPNHALFRAGEMGEEDWSLLTVGDDGKTASATDRDQPVTFGNQSTQVWAGPQVAYR
ncbi:hypothetical protein [Brunnivagina elsteri]|uniref:Uncharacterized protein n=1 Tax=Brunnivagina elsteri CCALA 953 TaxID=987040 RepID=A0A2A2TKU6_9CYAN|nr:hypothetical protein [Calothrix elsteri]PAX57088.1 hypothetical protein CK510_09610 [Calothrix elsteri CCALA 953]